MPKCSTPEVKSELLAGQYGMCAICRTEITNTRNSALDHCHKTGRIRGVLCRGCNVGIGSLREDPAVMVQAIEYLFPGLLSEWVYEGRI